MTCKKVEGQQPFGFSLCKYWLNIYTSLQLHWSRLKHFVDLTEIPWLSVCGHLFCLWSPQRPSTMSEDFWKEVNVSLLVPTLEMRSCKSTSTPAGFSSCICTGMQVLTLVLQRSSQMFGCYFQVWVKKKVGKPTEWSLRYRWRFEIASLLQACSECPSAWFSILKSAHLSRWAVNEEEKKEFSA